MLNMMGDSATSACIIPDLRQKIFSFLCDMTWRVVARTEDS